MRSLQTTFLCFIFFNVFSQKDDLPFHIYLIEPKRKCILMDELSRVNKLRITDSTISINQFSLGILRAKDTLFLENTGSEIQSQAIQLIRNAKEGDTIVIFNVRVLLKASQHWRMLQETITLKVGCKDEDLVN